MKILIAGMFHETNTFSVGVTAFDAFERGGMYPAIAYGEQMFGMEDVNIPVGGFIREMKGPGVEIVPSIWAGATPSARVRDDTFERIASVILDRASGTALDAVFIDMHGAMATQSNDDGEGELLERLRGLVGPDVKIVGSLDLHANVTQRMFDHADGLVAYRTYPHEDMAVTGARVATLLKSLLSGERQALRMRRLPFLIPINAMSTLSDPAKAIYDRLDRLEGGGVASLSFTMGFPATDFAECGPAIWAYGRDLAKVDQAVDALYDTVIAGEGHWVQRLLSPREAVQEAQRRAVGAQRPVIIADTQDNPGGGAGSDTTGMLRALLDSGVEDAAIGLIVDPAAVQAAHDAGAGADIAIALGGRSGTPGDAPLEGVFRVEQLSDGRCVFGGRMLTGKVADVGPTARLSIGGIQVVVCTWKDQLMDRNQYRMAGVEPEAMSILVNKSSTHFRADFEQIAEAILVAKAPGALLADPADYPWTKLPDTLRMGPLGPTFAKWREQRGQDAAPGGTHD